jgi:hypothetical protein
MFFPKVHVENVLQQNHTNKYFQFFGHLFLVLSAFRVFLSSGNSKTQQNSCLKNCPQNRQNNPKLIRFITFLGFSRRGVHKHTQKMVLPLLWPLAYLSTTGVSDLFGRPLVVLVVALQAAGKRTCTYNKKRGTGAGSEKSPVLFWCF